MSESILKKKNTSILGFLLQIPIWLIALLGLIKLFSIFVLSFTSYNVISSPEFVGNINYDLLGEDVVKIALGNTVVFVVIVGALLIATAVIPALFISKLPLPFGITAIVGYTLVSGSVMMPGVYSYIFSADSYGLLNTILLKNGIKKEPTMWFGEHNRSIAIFMLYIFCLAAVFTITYIGARLKKGALCSAIAICSIPVLMVQGKGFTTSMVGYPSVDYKADWLPTIIDDYLKTRYEAGAAFALTVVGIGLLVLWCAVVCGAVYGISKLAKLIFRSEKPVKIIGFILSGTSLFNIIVMSIPYIIGFFTAFKPLDEFVAFSGSVIPKRPTFENFSNLFSYYSDKSMFNFGASMSGIWRLLLVFIFAVLPCVSGLVLLKNNKKRKWLLLPLIALLALNPALQIDYNFTNIQIGEFVSGVLFAVLIFVSYYVVKNSILKTNRKIGDILLGTACLITTFVSVSLASINYSTAVTIENSHKSWYQINSFIISGGVARTGMSCAANLLLGLFTAATVVIPIALLFIIYLKSKRANKESANVNRYCGNCGSAVKTGEAFCAQCGNKL